MNALLLLPCMIASASAGEPGKVTYLMTKPLVGIPGKEVTLHPGDTFYEGPNSVHMIVLNASDTKPAKFLALLVKDKGAPILVPVQPK